MVSCSQEKEGPTEKHPPSPVHSEREALLVGTSAHVLLLCILRITRVLCQLICSNEINSTFILGICTRKAQYETEKMIYIVWTLSVVNITKGGKTFRLSSSCRSVFMVLESEGCNWLIVVVLFVGFSASNTVISGDLKRQHQLRFILYVTITTVEKNSIRWGELQKFRWAFFVMPSIQHKWNFKDSKTQRGENMQIALIGII